LLKNKDSIEEVAHKQVGGHEEKSSKDLHASVEKLLCPHVRISILINLTFKTPFVLESCLVEDGSDDQGEYDLLSNLGFALHRVSLNTHLISENELL